MEMISWMEKVRNKQGTGNGDKRTEKYKKNNLRQTSEKKTE